MRITISTNATHILVGKRGFDFPMGFGTLDEMKSRQKFWHERGVRTAIFQNKQSKIEKAWEWANSLLEMP